MRQIGSLSNERDAQRLAAYLVTQGIDSHAEQDTQGWAIWVRDENSLERARESFDLFKIDPGDSRYRGVEKEAEAIRRETIQQRLASQKNLVEMRGRWASATQLRAPLTVTVIALAILVTLVSGFGKSAKGLGRTVNDQLYFASPADLAAANNNPLASVMKGELWRVITPIFIHLDPIHLIFNMIMFFQFGRLVESMGGTVRLALYILLIAAVSNLAQALAPPNWEPLGGGPLFGGMSGVLYGLFGYAWMKSLFDPQPRFHLNQATVIILLGWLFLCMTPAIEHVANVAHVVGLVVGAVIGYLPTLRRT